MDTRKTRTWAEVSLGALRHNVEEMQRALPDGCGLLGVVKADAYGHGASEIAAALRECGCRYLAVACPQEALALRQAGETMPILILGAVDAAFATSALPNSAITELANYTDIVVVPIDGEIADNLIAQYPFYAKTTIGTDVYGVEEAETVAMMAVLTTTTDLDEEVVYNITKTIFENQTDLIAGNAHGREVTLDTALQGVTVDFHPGAVKYYKEKGIM